jgi:DNA ligase-1
MSSVHVQSLTEQNSRNNQPTMFKPKALTVQSVFQNLTDIAKASGNAVRLLPRIAPLRSTDDQSQNKKVGIIKKLLAACQGNEAKFIVRSLEGKLRIGLADKTLVVALAHAIVLRDMGKFNAFRAIVIAEPLQKARRYRMTR